MNALIGVDLTQDGSQVIAEVISYFMTPTEERRLIMLMSQEHDQIFKLQLNQNSQLLLGMLASAHEIEIERK